MSLPREKTFLREDCSHIPVEIIEVGQFFFKGLEEEVGKVAIFVERLGQSLLVEIERVVEGRSRWYE
jgi:hypothetical protein